MADFLASGRVVDFILVFMLCEGLLLALLYHWRGIGVAPAVLGPMLLAGAALLLALRAALIGDAWPWMALWLILALVAHLWDLGLRWRRSDA